MDELHCFNGICFNFYFSLGVRKSGDELEAQKDGPVFSLDDVPCTYEFTEAEELMNMMISEATSCPQ